MLTDRRVDLVFATIITSEVVLKTGYARDGSSGPAKDTWSGMIRAHQPVVAAHPRYSGAHSSCILVRMLVFVATGGPALIDAD